MADALPWVEADFFEVEPDGARLRCTLCPHACVLGDGEVGSCQVRRHHGGRMETATFSAAVRHFAAVERKPLYHYRPGTKALTLAAPGCSFACRYCLNHRLSQYGRSSEAAWTAEPVLAEELVADAAAHDRAIAFSYSEPSLAAELALAIAHLARPAGVDLLWKTNGFLTESAARRLVPHLAAVNVDLKSPDDRPHRRLTGAPVAPVLDFLRRLVGEGVWVEVSTPLMPGLHDRRDAVRRTADLIAAISPDIPWHLVRFLPDYQMSDHTPTTPESLGEAARIARGQGLRFVYVERALGAPGRCTYCTNCGAEVVTRDLWDVKALALEGGTCRHCLARIPGRWE